MRNIFNVVCNNLNIFKNYLYHALFAFYNTKKGEIEEICIGLYCLYLY